MSFVTKICANIGNGFINMGGIAAFQPVRQSHIMVRSYNGGSCVKASHVSDTLSQTSLFGSVLRMLQPVLPSFNQVAGFKVKGHLKRRCKDCYFVIRQQRHYVICPTHRRHKQMSMKKKDYKSWILTDATQSKVRPF